VRDLNKFPELVWLDKYLFIPPVVAGAFCFFVGHFWFGNAMMGLVVGFFFSTVILYHTTFAINSLCHMFGSCRYETGEESKNSLWLALITMGEGWHNNHHHYPLSARQGFFWWEVDITYYVLLGLQKLGLVWGLQTPPERLLRPETMIAGGKAGDGGFGSRNKSDSAPRKPLGDVRTMKEKAIERWENEGGEIPSVPHNQRQIRQSKKPELVALK
jgi:stearoyl-CoA desaturase (delta-9 desaturase)